VVFVEGVTSMSKPVQTLTIPVAAGNVPARIDEPGRYLTILTNTQPTVNVAFDGSAESNAYYPGHCYPGPAPGFRSIQFTSTVGCTVVVHISEEPIRSQMDSGIAGLQASLAAILAALGPLVTVNQQLVGGPGSEWGNIVLPVTPGPGLLIRPASAARCEIEIQAWPENGAGMVYLGLTDATCTAATRIIALAAGDPWWSEREKNAIYGCGSTGAEVISVREV
jgi:hypothetical protein